MPSPQRADARRNYARILAVAEAEVAEHGANASLEQIARVAGVGSATVRRHFPSRRALLDAVSHDRIDVLCASAREAAEHADARSALLDWLHQVIVSSVRSKGLAAALAFEGAAADSLYENSCATALQEAGTPLLTRAIAEGAIPADVTFDELITLLVGIVLATEHHADQLAEAERMFALTTAGLSPSR